MKKLLIALTILTSMSSFAGDSLLEKQIKLVNEGIASGQITDATKDFFLASIADLQKPKHVSINRIQEFTDLVCIGVESGEITSETKDFFLNAVHDFGKSCN
jgi:hypothetical protein